MHHKCEQRKIGISDAHRDERRVEDDLRAASEDVDGGVVDAGEPLHGLLHRARARGARHPEHREHHHLLLIFRSHRRGLQIAVATPASSFAGDRARLRAPRHGRVPRPQHEVAAHLGAAAVEAGEEDGSSGLRHFFRLTV